MRMTLIEGDHLFVSKLRCKLPHGAVRYPRFRDALRRFRERPRPLPCIERLGKIACAAVKNAKVGQKRRLPWRLRIRLEKTRERRRIFNISRFLEPGQRLRKGLVFPRRWFFHRWEPRVLPEYARSKLHICRPVGKFRFRGRRTHFG